MIGAKTLTGRLCFRSASCHLAQGSGLGGLWWACAGVVIPMLMSSATMVAVASGCFMCAFLCHAEKVSTGVGCLCTYLAFSCLSGSHSVCGRVTLADCV